MNAAFSTSVSAMAAAQAQLSGAARAAAHPRTSDNGVIGTMITMKQAEAAHTAAAAVARSASEMEDRVLDILV